MDRIDIPVRATAGFLLFWASCALCAGEPTVVVGGATQLFLDDFLIGRAEGVSKTVHAPTRHGDPVLTSEMPWESPYLCYPQAVLVDGKVYLYYGAYSFAWVGKGKKPTGFKTMRVICVAASDDGIHFTRPKLPYFVGEDFDRTNVVWAFYQGHSLNQVDGAGVIEDPSAADPHGRFKMVWNAGNTSTFSPVTKIEGPSVAFSPDGLKWTPYENNPVFHKFNSDTKQCVVYDPGVKKWVWLMRMWERSPSDGRIAWRQYGHRIRAVGRMESEDFLHWSEPEFVIRREKADPEFTDFYGLQVTPRHGVFVGFLWTHVHPTQYTKDIWPGSHGKMYAQLVVSRDAGKNWTRVDRHNMIFSPGPDGAWDGGQVYPGPFITIGDRHCVYYAGTALAHSGGRRGAQWPKTNSSIGLATWKLDRFVSIDGPAEGGTLTTIPIKFTGSRLEINARTNDQGSLAVEFLDSAGEPMEGVRQSDPFRGDELRHIITFGGNADVSKLAGKPIILRFHLESAELYGFTFRQ